MTTTTDRRWCSLLLLNGFSLQNFFEVKLIIFCFEVIALSRLMLTDVQSETVDGENLATLSFGHITGFRAAVSVCDLRAQCRVPAPVCGVSCHGVVVFGGGHLLSHFVLGTGLAMPCVFHQPLHRSCIPPRLLLRQYIVLHVGAVGSDVVVYAVYDGRTVAFHAVSITSCTS